MASDDDFNRKSFTTGHTGFGVPFATWPDRADVPRNAARPLRYIDRYLTVTQGEVFYITEAMAKLEGLERGPAGNTAMTAAVSLARDLPRDATIVVQETEYTGAGKHHWAQLNFAREMGVEVRAGDPEDNVPGKVIVIPERLEQIQRQGLRPRAHAQELRAQRAQARARGLRAHGRRHRVPRRRHQQRPGRRSRRCSPSSRRPEMAREDTYQQIRGHLAGLTDEQLEARFWELAQRGRRPAGRARPHAHLAEHRALGADAHGRRLADLHGGRRASARSAACWGTAPDTWCCTAHDVGLRRAEAARRLAAGEGWDLVEAKWGGAR